MMTVLNVKSAIAMNPAEDLSALLKHLAKLSHTHQGVKPFTELSAEMILRKVSALNSAGMRKPHAVKNARLMETAQEIKNVVIMAVANLASKQQLIQEWLIMMMLQ
jgi:hypothetical protein